MLLDKTIRKPKFWEKPSQCLLSLNFKRIANCANGNAREGRERGYR